MKLKISGSKFIFVMALTIFQGQANAFNIHFFSAKVKNIKSDMAMLSNVQDRSCVDVAQGLIKLSREYREAYFEHEELKLRVPLYKSAPYCYAQIFPLPGLFSEGEFKSRYSKALKDKNFTEARRLLYSNKTFYLSGLPSDLYTKYPAHWGILGSFKGYISSQRHFDPQSSTWVGREFSDDEKKKLNEQLLADSKDESCMRTPDTAFSFVKNSDPGRGRCFEDIDMVEYVGGDTYSRLQFFNYYQHDLSKIPSWDQRQEVSYYNQYYSLCNQEAKLEDKLKAEVRSILAGNCRAGYELTPETDRWDDKNVYIPISNGPSVELLDSKQIIDSFIKVHGQNALAYVLPTIINDYHEKNASLKSKDRKSLINRMKDLDPAFTTDLSKLINVPSNIGDYRSYLPASKELIGHYLIERENLNHSYNEYRAILNMQIDSMRFLKPKGKEKDKTDRKYIFQEWKKK